MAEDGMAGRLHRLNGHKFDQTLGYSEGQGSLASYSPWGCRELDGAEELNNNNLVVCAVHPLQNKSPEEGTASVL